MGPRTNMISVMIITLAVLFMCSACTDPGKATRILQEEGYTEIEITQYRAWSCSEDDTFKTGFRAKSPTGRHVTGTVCSDYFKGATIRRD